MNIKIITYENFPYGGASANLLRYFSFALTSEGNSIEVILPTGIAFGKNVELQPKKVGEINNIRYRHLGFTVHPSNFIGKLLDILWGILITPYHLMVSHFRNKLDLIIFYNISISKVFSVVLFKKIFKKKLIIILPEFYEKPNSISFSLIKWFDFYLGLKSLTKYADGLIPVSHFMSNYLKNELKIKKHILILPNLIDPEVFYVEKSNPFIPGKITIGYAGVPSKKDGVTDLLKSFCLLHKKHPETHLLIIGDRIGDNSILASLKDLSLQLGINDNVTFTGLVSFRRIPDLLNSCQILALTRPNGIFAEAGFPTKLGEYFACKKPVLITGVGDIPLYFNNQEHVIIAKPEDIESIANGFESIINNKELSMSLSINGYNWMNNNLNYRNLAPKLSVFINNVQGNFVVN